MKKLIEKILNKFHKGFCCVCGDITEQVNSFADGADKEEDGTISISHYKDYCHDDCLEEMRGRL
jgi:hypothetical protein